MNFTTFTGSSRRPRNVNLSGQPSNPNPFASSSWNRPGDPSRTVVQAQADRQQRQRERERLQSAKTIQRTYRGSLARASTRDLHRAQFDDAYTTSTMAGAEADAAERVNRGFPHLIRAFRLADKQDLDRLSRLCEDLEVAGLAALHMQPSSRQVQFLNDLLDVLDMNLRTDPLPEGPLIPRIIVAVVQEFASAVLVAETADRLFYILGRLSSRPDLSDQWQAVTFAAVRAPFEALHLSKGELASLVPAWSEPGVKVANPKITGDPTTVSDARRNAYRAFAFAFIPTPNIFLFESDCSRFLAPLNLDYLTAVITDDVPRALEDTAAVDSPLWLLAHLIQLYSAATGYTSDTILAPLYVLLSSLGREIRPRLAASADREDSYAHVSEGSEESVSAALPTYVKVQLQSLVSTESIENILGQLSE